MKRYSWYIIKKVLGMFRVQCKWLSSTSDMLMFYSPHGAAYMRKTNNVAPERLYLLLGQLNIDITDFEKKFEASL